MKTCSIEGCDKKHKGYGLCNTHYARLKRNGDPHTIRTMQGAPAAERYWARVQKGPDCWLWTGACDGRYGHFWESKDKSHMAHRYSYEALVGPIPEGKQLDHTCHSTLCVNPRHLRPATPKQNRENASGAPRSSTTGVRGVSFHKKDRVYHATVGHHGERVYAGRFSNLADAEEAVIAKRLELHTHNDKDRMANK